MSDTAVENSRALWGSIRARISSSCCRAISYNDKMRAPRLRRQRQKRYIARAIIATPAMRAGNTHGGKTNFGPRISRISSSDFCATALALDTEGMLGSAADADAGSAVGAGAGEASSPAPRNVTIRLAAATVRIAEWRPLIRACALGF